MNIASENRDIEVLFEEVMPGYRCIVSRQAEGAINLQFENLSSHNTITMPAVDQALWNTPEKLEELCAQIAGEFLVFCGESPPDPHQADRKESMDITGIVTERLYAILHSLNGQSEGPEP